MLSTRNRFQGVLTLSVPGNEVATGPQGPPISEMPLLLFQGAV